MKELAECDLQRVDAAYVLLDTCYLSLRSFAAVQRSAVVSGDLTAMSMCESHIRLLSITISCNWQVIQGIMAEPQPAKIDDFVATGRPQ